MIQYYSNSDGGKLLIQNETFLLVINTGWFFPAKKKDLNLVLRHMYNNDITLGSDFDIILRSIILDLDASRKYNTDYENKRIDKNIEQMRIFNGLYNENKTFYYEKEGEADNADNRNLQI